jgi:predicted permease
MAALGRWVRRLLLLLRRRRVERAMDEELRHHLDCEVEEHIRSGLAPEEARRAALAAFGGVEQIKEEARDARGTRPLEDLIADVAYGARVLRRHPSFTAAAVLTFALGSGAATAIFSVVYGVLLRPLSYADPARLVVLWERNVARGKDRNVVSVANFEAWRDRCRSFDGMAALVPSPVTLTEAGLPERLAGAEVSAGYFRLLGVAPALGQDFAPADSGEAESRVAILSHGLWQRRFGADPSIVGRALRLGGVPHTVIGVMPAGFDPPRFGWLGDQELWLPFRPTPQSRAWGRFLLVVARLRSTVSLEQARGETAAFGERLAGELKDDAGWSVSLVPLADQITGDVRTALLVLQGAVGLLLLIAVTNVATLSLCQTMRRSQELATRRVLGATDRRLFRQLLTQSALVGLCGAVAGGLVAWPAVRLLVALAPPGVPRLDGVRVDTPVLLATMAVALLATLVFGTIAARGGFRPARGSALVIIEIGVALTLGVVAVLSARSFASLRAVDLGFGFDGVVAARVALPDEPGEGGPRQRVLFEQLLERVRGLPGVQSASLITTRPFGGLATATTVGDAQRGTDPGSLSIVADVRRVDRGLFQTLGIALVRGHSFDAHESAAGTPRVVISESLREAVWPGEDPLGRGLHLSLYGGISAEVIGVVSDVHLMDVRTPPRPTAYLSDVRFPDGTRDLIVRAGGDAGRLVPALRAVLAAIAPNAALYQVTTLSRSVAASLAADRFTALLLAGFAGLAVLLSAVGVFSVISAEVARRRKEIGIRIAVGARPAAVALMLLREALRRAALGVSAGAMLALWCAHLMKSLLFGVPPGDPVSFLAVTAVVAGVVAVATLLPAVQILRTPPLSALREG